MKIALLASAIALAAAAPSAAATNLLTNGSFETGNTAGWSASGDLGFFGVCNACAQDGFFAVSDGAVGDFSLLSQTVATIVGRVYTVSGWLATDGGQYNEVGFGINGGNQVDLVNTGMGYTNFSFSFAGTGSDTLTVFDRNDPGFNLYDNFSISSAVPEASSWAMLIAGFGLVGAAARRRKALAA